MRSNMAPVGIVGLGAYVPPDVMTNDDWAEIVDTSDEWITTKTGIEERRIAADDVCTSDLAVIACQQAMDEAGIGPGDVDMLILATSSPDVPLSSTAGITQHKLGCIKAAAFDINAVCAGWVHALDVGARFAGTPGYDNVLVVGAEVYSRILNWEDRTTCVLFGDGAGAVILQPSEDESGVLSTHLHSEGKHLQDLWLPAPGSKYKPFMSKRLIDDGLHTPFMNGREVFKNAVTRFPEVINEALKHNNLSMDDVALVIPHQANLRISQAVAKRLGVGMDKIYSNIHKYGNTTAASIPIAMSEALEEGRFGPGDNIILAAFGAGFTWGSAAIRW